MRLIRRLGVMSVLVNGLAEVGIAFLSIHAVMGSFKLDEFGLKGVACDPLSE